jgi:hypothetical protein
VDINVKHRNPTDTIYCELLRGGAGLRARYEPDPSEPHDASLLRGTRPPKGRKTLQSALQVLQVLQNIEGRDLYIYMIVSVRLTTIVLTTEHANTQQLASRTQWESRPQSLPHHLV